MCNNSSIVFSPAGVYSLSTSPLHQDLQRTYFPLLDTYDATGDRILRRSTSISGTSMTVYAFGLEEHVYDGSGTNQSNTYYYSLHDRLIGKTNGTTTQFFLSDELGSMLTTFNATAGGASVQGNQTYGPYGNKRYTSGSMGTDKGFTGQYNDPLTGLDYYKARYYDPAVGRFLTADTVQGNMQGMDPYTYVGGNPETHNDPTGHWRDRHVIHSSEPLTICHLIN